MRFHSKMKAGISLAKAKATRQRIPLAVSWAITGRCNLACAYCGFPQKTFRELTESEALNVVKEMASSGTKRLSITGGEPLLRNDIGEVIKTASDSGISVSVNTNGQLLRERLNEMEGADHISVSIDGPRVIHDSKRGKGSFEKALDGAKKSKSQGINTSLLAVLTKENTDSVVEILNIAKDNDMKVLFQPVETYRHASLQTRSMAPNLESLKNAVNILLNSTHVMNSRGCLKQFVNSSIKPDRCAAGRVFCRIEPDGSMYACGRSKGTKTNPDVRKGFLKGVLSLPQPKCKACLCAGQIEISLLYNLRGNMRELIRMV